MLISEVFFLKLQNRMLISFALQVLRRIVPDFGVRKEEINLIIKKLDQIEDEMILNEKIDIKGS